MPAIQLFPQALGAACMPEGATPGGVIIAGIIRKQLQLFTPEGFTFFNGYGQAVQAMWKIFHIYIAALADETAQRQLLAQPGKHEHSQE